MTKVIELLDAVKAAKNVTTDYALGKVLDIPSGHICEYYKSKRTPNEYACLQILAVWNTLTTVAPHFRFSG